MIAKPPRTREGPRRYPVAFRPVPLFMLLPVGVAVARQRSRSFGEESSRFLRLVKPSPVAIDTQHLPRNGPFVVVGNHYERPGLGVVWGVMVVNVAVHRTGERPRELHLIMTDELLDVRLGPIMLPRKWVRMVIARLGRVYGFGLVSPRESGLVGGSAGLRAAARYLAAGEPLLVLPEGTASKELLEARSGVGAAVSWLARGNVPLVPVGIAEIEGVLTAQFGPPFALPEVEGDKYERDEALSDTIMRQIAGLLPPDVRGHYPEA